MSDVVFGFGSGQTSIVRVVEVLKKWDPILI